MMDIACWNIRGFNRPNKQEDLLGFLRKTKIGLLAFVETKVKLSNEKKIAEKMFQGWGWCTNSTEERKGRIWVAWKPRSYNVLVKKITNQIIHCEVINQISQVRFCVTFVYGVNDAQGRKTMWEDIVELAARMDNGWVVLGDFNALLNTNERVGGEPVKEADIQDFKECITTSNLHELKNTGPFFSWNNKQVWTRLDRVMVNHHWYSLGYTHLVFMTESISDHCPMLLSFKDCPHFQSQFRFCDMWTTDPTYEGILRDYLPASKQGSWMQTLSRVLMRLQRPLRRLNKDRFGDIHNQQDIHRELLMEIQAELHKDPHNQDLQNQEAQMRQKYITILNSSISLMRQQSKIKWLNVGDTNSRAFFALLRQRRVSNCIYAIQNDQGETVEGFDKVSKVMTEFFRELIGKKGGKTEKINLNAMQEGPTLSVKNQRILCEDVTDSQVKEAMFSIPDVKSPGPDGYTSGFYKKHWGLVGPLVCKAVREFFSTGKLHHQWNETNLLLIPKVPHPQKASEFRPIACCNVIYKCITKILSSRLTEVLPEIIDHSQGAFVKGRELVYNVLVCQELARGYNRKGISPRCMMKIDLRKAYDSIQWKFLADVLGALHFPPYSLNG